jgi:dimethylglycine dehydrogenase
VTWHGCGSFRLAYTEDEMDWLRHTLSVGRALGFNIELVGPDRVRGAASVLQSRRRLGALHTPDDGHVDPPASPWRWPPARGNWVRGSSAAAARPTSSNCRTANGWSRPRKGDIVCEHVVNAGGTYARQMGEWSGLQLPMTSMTHHYFVTDEVPEFRDLETRTAGHPR